MVLKPGTVWAGKGSNKHVESKSTGSSGGKNDGGTGTGTGGGDGHSGDSDSSGNSGAESDTEGEVGPTSPVSWGKGMCSPCLVFRVTGILIGVVLFFPTQAKAARSCG